MALNLIGMIGSMTMIYGRDPEALMKALEDEDGVRGKACHCGDVHCLAANRLREVLGGRSMTAPSLLVGRSV